jgi:hypothetical protein
MGVLERYVPVDVVGRFSERVAWHYVYGMNEAVSLVPVSGMLVVVYSKLK